MISFHPYSDLSPIRDLKAQYLQSLLAPMDGMWEVGFTDPAPHWEIRVDGERAGYYAANDDGTLLQFFVMQAFEGQGRILFDRVVAQDSINQAVVSTIDPPFLALCLDVQKGVSVHTYLYEAHTEVKPDHLEDEDLDFRLVEASELDRTVAFQQACLGGGDEMVDWLRGYSGNLIKRNELFVLCRDDEWLGLGEHRASESQTGIADLGMMVAPAHRRKGWAVEILTRLRALCTKRGQRAICSTTVDNVGAKISIVRSGFVSRHRIMNVAL